MSYQQSLHFVLVNEPDFIFWQLIDKINHSNKSTGHVIVTFREVLRRLSHLFLLTDLN